MYILAFVIALFTSWLLTPYVKKLAFRIGALDKPDGRKVHKGIMPRLGGLAIYLGFVVAVLCSMHLSKDVMALLLGGTVILIVGIIDDVYQLPAKVKLLGQIAAAAVLVLFDIRIEWLNNPWVFLSGVSVDTVYDLLGNQFYQCCQSDGWFGWIGSRSRWYRINNCNSGSYSAGVLSCCCNYSCIGWRYCRFYAL